jgi:restriction system protein
MIPDFQSIMLPIVEIFSDEKEHNSQELCEQVSDKYKLSEEERNQLLPSGTQRIIVNRISWALSHLSQADLVERTKRGYYKIGKSGIDVLKAKPKKIDLKLLRTLPLYQKWREGNKDKDKSKNDTLSEIDEIENVQTPEELIEFSFLKLKEDLASELLIRIKQSSPSFFERLVVDLLLKMGYGGSKREAGQVLGKSGDGGIDGLIKEDKLGLDTIYVQAKRWENTVPVSQVRDFAGSLLSKKAKKGIFISTSDYPKSAYEFVSSIEPRIVLINGKELADLMIENNVGLATKTLYEIKKIDSDYFEED